MTNFFYAKELLRPEDVRCHLAQPKLHWKKNFSAYELAYSWMLSNGIPTSVRAVLDTCPDYRDAELVEAFVERDVNLRTDGRRSQTDIMAFVATRAGYAVVAVEGKVDEPFGSLISEWRDGSVGKERRLSALCATLGLNPNNSDSLRYQLFHRTASAIYEAQRYRCDKALMLVHSFSPTKSSPTKSSFADFADFSKAMGMAVSTPGEISSDKICEKVRLRLAWSSDSFSA